MPYNFHGKEILDQLSVSKLILMYCGISAEDNSISRIIRKTYEAEDWAMGNRRPTTASMAGIQITQKYSYIRSRVYEYYGLTEKEQDILSGLRKTDKVVSGSMMHLVRAMVANEEFAELPIIHIEQFYGIACKGRSLQATIIDIKRVLYELEHLRRDYTDASMADYNKMINHAGLSKIWINAMWKKGLMERKVFVLKGILSRFTNLRQAYCREIMNRPDEIN